MKVASRMVTEMGQTGIRSPLCQPRPGIAVLILLAGLLSAPASGQSVEDVRGLQLSVLASWMDTNPGVVVCIAALSKPSTWQTPFVPEADIPAPSPSELAELESRLSPRYPGRVVPYCVPVRDGLRPSALDELLRRAERREECDSIRSAVAEADARDAPPEEINELFRTSSLGRCYPSNRSLVGPYGRRAAQLAVSTALFQTQGSAMVLMAPSFLTSRNNYLFCSFEQVGATWSQTPDCELVTYTHEDS